MACTPGAATGISRPGRRGLCSRPDGRYVMARTEIRSEPHPTVARDTPPVLVSAPRGVVGTAVQVVILLLLLSILAAVLLVLFAVVSLVNVPGQVTSGVGSQFGGVAAQAGKAVTEAQQAVQN